MLLTAFLYEGAPVSSRLKSQEIPIPFRWESTVSVGYQDISSVQNIFDFAFYASVTTDPNISVTPEDIRNEYISTFLPGWSTLTDADRMSLINYGVWNITETLVVLDALVPAAERIAILERLALSSTISGEDTKVASDGTVWRTTIVNGGMLMTTKINPDGSN